MKQRTVKDTFTCDNCGKKIDIESDPERISELVSPLGYPYNEGWTYIYKFSWKTDQTEHEVHDKHFCGKRCLYAFVMKSVQKGTKQCEKK